MLDIREIRANPDAVIARLNTRGGDFAPQVTEVLACDETRRKAETEQQGLLSQRKQTSKQIGMLKGKGEDTSAIEAEVRGINDAIAELEQTVSRSNAEQERLLQFIPNLPHAARHLDIEGPDLGVDLGNGVLVPLDPSHE